LAVSPGLEQSTKVSERSADLQKSNDPLLAEIGERKRAEEKLARLNQTLQTLNQCNQALVRATGEYELLRSVCQILVEVGGLRMAWVGYREFNEQKSVRPVAQAGYEDGYLEGVNVTWADTERGRGPAGTAIRRGAICSNRDILTDPRMAPWRAEALKRHYASSIALPLMSGNEAFGALSLYAAEPDAFNENTIEQFTDLANNLAYGVIALRTREQRRRAEEALRESEQRLQDIVDNTTSVVFVKDLELRYILVNREYERRHGVQREQIRGKTDFDIHSREVAQTVREHDRQVIAAGLPIQFEEAVPSAEGDRWVIVAKFLLRDHTGKPYAVCGIATDITERKRAESEVRELNALLEKRVLDRTIELVRSNEQLVQAEVGLRESEARFSAAFRASPALMTISRLSDEKYIEVNDAFIRWYGLRREDIIGHTTKELGTWLNPEDRARFWADLRRHGSVREFECKARNHRGVGTLLVSADIIEINREPHVIASCLDITQRKLAEAELLRTLAREKELGQLRSNFVSMVSHEFRTPLGIIQSSAEILEDYLDQLNPDERKDHLQSIRNSTRRMAETMEEVLFIGGFDAAKIELKPAALNLHSFARRLVDEVMSATARRCPIELSLVNVPSQIQADDRLLRHIFNNLLTNAVKYSDAGRTVNFEIASTGAEIVCVIRDLGIGIPEADREWLFNTFQRGRNVEDRPGTGLGLVIVRSCVDLYGGKIKVESIPGEGTAVTVNLPLISPDSPQMEL
jgi:PAS domain S-box-containing protein